MNYKKELSSPRRRGSSAFAFMHKVTGSPTRAFGGDNIVYKCRRPSRIALRCIRAKGTADLKSVVRCALCVVHCEFECGPCRGVEGPPAKIKIIVSSMKANCDIGLSRCSCLNYLIDLTISFARLAAFNQTASMREADAQSPVAAMLFCGSK